MEILLSPERKETNRSKITANDHEEKIKKESQWTTAARWLSANWRRSNWIEHGTEHQLFRGLDFWLEKREKRAKTLRSSPHHQFEFHRNSTADSTPRIYSGCCCCCYCGCGCGCCVRKEENREEKKRDFLLDTETVWNSDCHSGNCQTILFSIHIHIYMYYVYKSNFCCRCCCHWLIWDFILF